MYLSVLLDRQELAEKLVNVGKFQFIKPGIFDDDNKEPR